MWYLLAKRYNMSKDNTKPACSLWLPDKTIVEQVQGFKYYIKQPDGETKEIDSYGAYKPFDDELVQRDVIKFAEKPIEYGSKEELFNSICAYVHKYVDIPIEYERIFVLNAMYSWIHDAIGTVAYTRALGDTGVGKTRLLDVFGNISYKPCFASGAIGSAPVFRIIEKYKPTLIVDESDFKDSSAQADIIKIFNVGYQRNKPILRCGTKDFNTLEAFDAFCPKMLATREQFKDIALESRCLTKIMEESEREDIPVNLPPEFYTEALEIRNKLLMFRFNNLNNIKQWSLEADCEKRIVQICEPLLSVSDETQPYVIDYVKLHSRNMQSQRSNTTEYRILSAIKTIFEGSSCIDRKATASEIADNIEMYEGSVGKILNRLGLIQEKDNKKRYYSCLTNKSKLAKLYKKYDMN